MPITVLHQLEHHQIKQRYHNPSSRGQVVSLDRLGYMRNHSLTTNYDIDDTLYTNNDQYHDRNDDHNDDLITGSYSSSAPVTSAPAPVPFGGEVKRVLNMADGVLLVVDSVEGPKPQTWFVLDKGTCVYIFP